MPKYRLSYFFGALFFFIGLNTSVGRNACYAQEKVSYKEAVYYAAKGQYAKATKICQTILLKSPDDINAGVLLGRLYSWKHQYDSARVILLKVLNDFPNNRAALNALINVELWSNNPDKALQYCNKALSNSPVEHQIALKKAKALYMLGKYKEARNLTESLLINNPENKEPADFLKYLNQNIIPGPENNGVGVTYAYNSFSRTYSPWNDFSVYMFHKNKSGAILGRVSYANRFNTNGLQYELSLYPRISSSWYAYINAGYSGSFIFPKYSAAISLYHQIFKNSSVFKDMEVNMGVRYRNFIVLPNPLITYTGSLSFYYHRFWLSLNPYLTPESTGLDQSYYLIVKYYLHYPKNSLTFVLSSGLYPQNYLDPQFHQPVKESTNIKSIEVGYRTTLFSENNILRISTGYEARRYFKNPNLTRLTMEMGLERLF